MGMDRALVQLLDDGRVRNYDGRMMVVSGKELYQ